MNETLVIPEHETLNNITPNYKTYNLSIKDDPTTDTEDAAIAILAIQGFITTPRGSNAPAANGIPIML